MSCSEIQEGLIIEHGVEIGGAGSNPLASAEKQCELLLIEIKALKEFNHKLAHENGTLKRGREIQRLKIREQAEELQKQEVNQMHSNLCDSERDERDMQIADELNSVYEYVFDSSNEGSMGRILESIIKQLQGE